MPEFTQLLRRALTFSALNAAFDKVRGNAGGPGTDGQTIAEFGAGLEQRLRTLQRQVLDDSYRAQPLLRLWLPRSGKQPRGLAVPAVRDRVLQTAVALVLTPLFEAEFEDCSFAYRRGRSVRQAVERIGLLQRKGYKWVVDADIEAFFDRIPHDALLRAIAKVTVDGGVLALIGRWLSTPILEDGALRAVDVGIGQGSPLSPLLANLYLDHLDESLLDRDFALVRYADDFIVLTKNREAADDALELTHEILRRLHLRINPLKTRIVNFDQGFEFLGWNFVRSLAVPRGRRDQGGLDRSSPLQSSPLPVVAVSPRGREPAPAPTEELESPLHYALRRAQQEAPGWQASREEERIPPVATVEEQTADPDSAETSPPIRQAGRERDQIVEFVTAQGEAADVGGDWEQFTVESMPAGAIPLTDDDAATDPTLPAPGPIQRTLYLVDQGAALCKEGERIVVRKQDVVILEVPAINVDQVMIFGNNALTTSAMQLCMRHRVPIALLSRLGRYYGRIDAGDVSSIGLQQVQFGAAAAPERALAIARGCVQGKLDNSALILSRYARRHGDQTIVAAAARLREQARHTKTATTLDALRGMEGSGARCYFGAWKAMLDAKWGFTGRKRQPPPDPVNVLLSFGYTLLYHCVAGLIQARGLNPHVGFLHVGSSEHLALASDLMEEFRAVIIDSVVLNLCLNDRLALTEFRSSQDGCTLSANGARAFIHAFETKLNSESRQSAGEERIDLRRMIDRQVLQLARVLRSPETVAYRACVFR